ncbi:MAG: GNAT family N-acetyltransferase [Planctomycetota bacterium]|nr:GNAT family N-acetyltransferase [Planctomycetota bacterium]
MHPPVHLEPYDAARDRADLARLMLHAFNSPAELTDLWITRAGPENFRVARLHQPGPALATLAYIPWGQFFCGRRVSAIGIAGVATAPEARGQGLATAMMHDALREMHAMGAAISNLYPATRPLYRRAGYELAGSTFECRVRLRELSTRPGDRTAASLRPAADEDLPRIEALYRERIAERHGAIDRAHYGWPRVRQPKGEPAHGFVIEEHGAITGWIFHLRRDAAPNAHEVYGRNTLAISDVQAYTPAALRRIVAHLADHASMVSDATFDAGPAHPLLTALDEQSFTLQLVHHWMVRILDVRRALLERGYWGARNAALALDVADELIHSNREPLTLTLENGRPSVTPGHTPGAPSLRLDIRDLAAIYTGYLTPHQAALSGRITASDDTALTTARDIFLAPHPAPADRF